MRAALDSVVHSTNSHFSSENYTRLLNEALAARQHRICHLRMVVIDGEHLRRARTHRSLCWLRFALCCYNPGSQKPAIDLGSCGNGPVWYSIQSNESRRRIMEMGRQLSRCGWRSQFKGCDPRKFLLYVHTIPFSYHPSQNETYTWPVNENICRHRAKLSEWAESRLLCNQSWFCREWLVPYCSLNF